MYDAGIRIAKGAAMMTETNMKYQILGTAWPGHFEQSISTGITCQYSKSGISSEKRINKMARAVQKLVEAPKKTIRKIDGLRNKIDTLKGSVPFSNQ